ncbi:hypothetical protein Tco_0324530 [Tanacetum coccineum]
MSSCHYISGTRRQAFYAKELPISSPDPITPPAIFDSISGKELAVLDTTGYHIRELIEAFIRGLPQSIEGNVTASKPQTMVEATNIDKANGSDINIIRLQEQSDRNEF